MSQQTALAGAEADLERASVDPGLRIDTLVRLRWMAILGQLVTVFVIGVIWQYALPLIGCLVLIAIASAVNIYSKLKSRSSPRVDSKTAALYLAFDVLQLSGLLYLTGGLSNPFCFLLLVPVIVSATTLKQGHTITLGVLVAMTSSILVDFHHPLPWHGEEALALPTLYLVGVWTSMIACLVFMGSYAFRVASESRNLSAALTATELVLAREQHLSALDGMAAAAAHELGTPLSTIAVVVRELEREIPADTPHGNDIRLLSSQAKRCRDILAKLTSLTTETAGPMVVVRLTDMVEEIAEPYRNFGVDVSVEKHNSVNDADNTPEVLRLPGVLYGLSNLIENAVDFAKAQVTITMVWDDELIIIKIVDDGPGFSEAVSDRLGEPYVTSRQQRAEKRGVPIEGGGLGLGIFIAKTLLERSGATLRFANRGGSQKGADVTVVWPKNRICFQDEPSGSASMMTAERLAAE